MIFNELSYFALFLLPCVLAFHASARLLPASWAVQARPWILTFFGVSFFLYFGYLHFGGFLGSLAVLIFVWELVISRWYRPGSWVCLLGIVQAVVILVVFKYLFFFSSSWNDLVRICGLPFFVDVPKLTLPLGVSFFTFEFIHYAADCYTGKIERGRMSHYAAFIFFFPSMVAGPIKRYQEFEPQLLGARFEPSLASQGITRILVGLAKKHVLADTLTLWSDRLNTEALYEAAPGMLLLWLLAYGFKIYFDFSGYSDIAIGSGYLFGLRIPENFCWPYLSTSITEFWRRWHISLGRWLFDYVYVPLGGSKRGRVRTAFNLMVTFLVSGLWHGAAYNFIAWGAWHGALMVTHRAWSRLVPPMNSRLVLYLSALLTFVVVQIGWAFFCMDWDRAVFCLSRIIGLR